MKTYTQAQMIEAIDFWTDKAKVLEKELEQAEAKLDELDAKLSERDADCAAMREALEQLNCEPHSTVANSMLHRGLSSTAGRELLERLQKAEAERDVYKSTLQDLIDRNKGAAFSVMEALQLK